MAAIFNVLHPEVEGKEKSFLEWKRLRTRHTGYIRNLHISNLISDDERNHLMDLIDVCTTEEYKSFNLRGLRDKTLSIKSVSRRIRYPKKELGENYKRKTINRVKKVVVTIDEQEFKDRSKLKAAAHRRFKSGVISIDEKKVLYEYANNANIDGIRNHEFFPKARGNTKIVKEKISRSKKITKEKKKDKASAKEKAKEKAKDIDTESESESDTDTEINGNESLSAGDSSDDSSGNERASESTERRDESTENNQSTPRKCDIPVRRERPVRRPKRVPVPSEG